MSTLWLDFETFSATPIAAGGYRYAADARPILFGYAIDDRPAQVMEVWPDTPLDGPADPRIDRVVAHNAQFDRLFAPQYPLALWRCTMIQAMAHSLPAAVADLCALFRIETDKAKAKDGKALVQLFCRPQARTDKIFDKTTHPDEWERFKEYCRLDVEAMRAVAAKLPTWNYSVYE